MVYLAEKATSVKEARQMLERALQDGSALEKFKIFIQSQGGDASVVEDTEKLPQAAFCIELEAKEDGFISEIVADQVGNAAMLLGAGRATKDSIIDLSVGLVLRKKIGDYVQKGESLVTIYSSSPQVEDVKKKLEENIKISTEKVVVPTLIYDLVTE